MFPKKQFPLLVFVFFVCLLRSVQLESSVPALLWSNQVHLFDGHDQFKSHVDQIDSNDLDGYLGKNTPIIAFVQDELSVEQFAANDASFVSTIFENPQFNPLFFTNVKNPGNIYSEFETDTKSGNSKRNVVYLSGKNLNENDEIIKSYVEQANETGPAIFILTGKNNQYLNKNIRVRREVSKEDTKIEVLSIVNDDKQPCLFFYSKKMSITFNNDKESKTLFFSDIPIPSGNCLAKNEKKDGKEAIAKVLHAEVFNLDYKNQTAKTNVKISFNFFQNPKSFLWEVKPFVVEYDGKSFINNNLNLGTENYFSYSCQKSVFSLKPKINETNDYKSASIVFHRFQLQPFAIVDSKYKFEDSFDCSVWFTLPIFASLFVCLLLVLILYFGVRALLSISTPDRFENPKGRTLIITNFEE